MTSDSRFSRRAFLKGASAAAVGGAVGDKLLHDAPARDVHRVRGVRTIPKGLGPLKLRVNGQEREVQVEPRTTLLDALRDGLDLTGSKKVCDRGACGGCTVLLDGEPVNSCMTLAWDAADAEIRTIEGIATTDSLHPVQAAFIESDALQCGFCTPGFVMSAVACLDRHAQPSRDTIRHELSGNICRCGTYSRVVEAVERASQGGGR
jgi:aerobic-type carbon monoxide dehydrogenase small subunit (CoxS/CutS family)